MADETPATATPPADAAATETPAPAADATPPAEVPVGPPPATVVGAEGRVPEDPATAGKTDQELIAESGAPPLHLPEGMTIQARCLNPDCGLTFAPGPDEDLHGKPCPNCGTALP